MLLQTNSYVVPAEKRVEHQRLLRRFRQVMTRLGCDAFEVYEQVGADWSAAETSGRFVQMMRFRDHQHQRAVQAAERTDPGAQQLIAEFCDLINLPYQQQQALFAVGFYRSVVAPPERGGQSQSASEQPTPAEPVDQPVEETASHQHVAAGNSDQEPQAPSPAHEPEAPQPSIAQPPPLPETEIDIEALAAEEIAEMHEPSEDSDSARRG